MTRVVVVDDAPTVQSAVKAILEKIGIEVVLSDSASLHRVLRSQSADVVLCDIFMPDCDGIEIIRKLRREHPDVKVVAMSGGGFGNTVDLLPVARQLGAVEVLYKPFDQATLIAAIERATA